jgi:hypothetical protein
VDVVLGDTAGRLHTSDDLMAQLAKIDRNIDPDMTLFVDEAVAGQDAVNRALPRDGTGLRRHRTVRPRGNRRQPVRVGPTRGRPRRLRRTRRHWPRPVPCPPV